MPSAPHVIGVDVGTGSVRAAVFSLSGERRGMGVAPIQTWKPRADFVEQSSADIWANTGHAVRAALAQSAVAAQEIVGIAFDATCSLVALDQHHLPLTVSPTGRPEQNIIVWMDHRATPQADAINAQPHAVLQCVGGKISPEMEPPKLLWLKQNLPDTWKKAGKFLDLADFLAFQSTGIDVRSLCTNVCKWTYLGQKGDWDHAFFNTIGLADLFTGNCLSKNIRPMGEKIAPLAPAAAQHLGLTTGCVVGVGIIDAHAGGLGLLGGAWENASEQGTPDTVLETVIALIGGTSNCHMAVSKQPVFIPGVWGPYHSAMIPGLWLTEGGQSAAGSLIDFVIETHPAFAALSIQATQNQTTVYQLLNERVQQIQKARNFADPAYLTRQLHVLDYHLGNRSPKADPHARGVIDGLPLDASADTLAILYLATVQAVAYGTRDIIETLNRHGYRIHRVLVTGGGTKNPLWLRQHADATGIPLMTGQEPESVLLGSAILAATAAGVFPTLIHAMRGMSRPGQIIKPNPETRHYHDAKFQVYQRLYEQQLAHRNIMAAV